MLKDINFFDQFQFCCALDGEPNGTGNYIHKKKANVITVEMEEISWEKDLLGNCSPQVLSDTMVYLISLFFALRSGEELGGDCTKIYQSFSLWNLQHAHHTVSIKKICEDKPSWIEAEEAYPERSCPSCQ